MDKTTLPPQIGRYRIIRPLGTGGMASLFLGENPGLNDTFRRRVAIKLIRPEFSNSPMYRAQFADEQRILGKLNHPNIVSAIDSGEHNGALFIVMEYVHGIDLGRLLEQLDAQGRRIGPILTTYITLKVASALAYAHSEFTLIHRDVSPSNILLGFHGEVKLTDFGIARFDGRETETKIEGQLKGKPAFMSPEQLLDPGNLDGRSDLFPLGHCMYMMLTGKNLFRKDGAITTASVVQAILGRQEIPNLSRDLPDLEPELESLVHQLLSRDRNERPESAAHVVETLLRCPMRPDADRLLSLHVRGLQRSGPISTSSVLGTKGSRLTPQTTDEVSMVEVDPPPTMDESIELELEESSPFDPSFAGLDPPAATDSARPRRTKTTATPNSERSARFVGAASTQPPSALPPPRPRWTPRAQLAAAGLVVATTTASVILALQHAPAPATPIAPPLGAPASSTTPTRSPTAPPLSQPSPAVPAPTNMGAPPPSNNPTSTNFEGSAPVAAEKADGHQPRRRKGSATLHIDVLPWGYAGVDGKEPAQAPLTVSNLTSGPHTVDVRKTPDSTPQRHTVYLTDGENRFEFELPMPLDSRYR